MTSTHSMTRALAPARLGMTLLELLAVISIIGMFLSILMPVLHAVHEDGSLATCLNNLHQIGAAAGFYNEENTSIAKGYRPTLPWYLDYDKVPHTCTIAYNSEFVYGGFRAIEQHPYYPDSDAYCIANEYRPFNKYIAPGITGSSIIKAYICPSDRTCATPLVGQGVPPVEEERYSSWEVNGNSYALNWYWPYAPPMNGGGEYWDLPCMSSFGSAMLSKKVGGAAAEFVVFMENMMNAYTSEARPRDWPTPSPQQTLGVGWHGRLSMYCMAMWDGHAEYSYIDTRYTNGPGYDLWPESDTQWPTPCGESKKGPMRR